MSKIISMLASRKDSKFLAKFLHAYEARTEYSPLLTTYSEQDTWNAEIIRYFSKRDLDYSYEFFPENRGLGRNGLHLYYQEMLYRFRELNGDWLIYFCEDHYITLNSWDAVYGRILDKFDPTRVYIGVPRWDNIGAVNHVISRGAIEALGWTLGPHGNLDSVFNRFAEILPPGRLFDLPVIGHDWTHDKPYVLDDSYTKVPLSVEGERLPHYDSIDVQAEIKLQQQRLLIAISEGK